MKSSRQLAAKFDAFCISVNVSIENKKIVLDIKEPLLYKESARVFEFCPKRIGTKAKVF